MKKLFAIICLMAVSTLAFAQQAEWNANGTVCRIQFYSPSIVRVVKYPAGHPVVESKSLVVTLLPQDVVITKTEGGGKITLGSSELTVVLDKRTGNIQFLHKGKNLLKEKSHSFEERTSGPDKGAYQVRQTYQLDREEPIYGLGILQDGKMNRRGTKKFMEQDNIEDFQYVIQSIKGWGIFWDNYSRAEFDDNADGMSFTAEVGDCLDYYFMYGGSTDGVTAQVRNLSGQVPMFPLWTYGYWQCRERYKTQNELLEVINKYRDLQVPLDGIVQDWQYWGGNYTWNAMDFIADGFPNGKAMIDSIHGLNAHLMISVWASFGPMTKAYKQLAEKGLLFDIQTWPMSGIPGWPPRMDYLSGVRVYDAYSKEARDIYWNNLKNLFDQGVDAWWMDSTDPDYFYPQESDYDRNITAMGSWRKMRNAFPLCTVSGVYDHQRATSSEKRVFIMTRSAFAGQQRYGGGYWTGDVDSSWEMLRAQIPAGLNFTLTGNPYFNTDIGGFSCDQYNTMGAESAPKNPQFQELYVRWMQYAFFCPVFRSHGTNAPREIYFFGKKGEPVYDAIEKTIRLRYQFLPYWYSMAWQVTSNGQSYMRALVSDFPTDKHVWNMADEFMLGKSVLAAPITQAQYTKEEVLEGEASQTQHVDFTASHSISKYLPAGAQWYDFWTDKKYKGGQQITLQTTLDRMPMFVRAGSILPLAPVMQYAAEKAWNNLEIRVYPGANATFTLYEDEGDNYNYEKGVYSTVDFTWNEAKKELTIANRKGAYPGMLQNRQFQIKMIGGSEKTIQYDGTIQKIAF